MGIETEAYRDLKLLGWKSARPGCWLLTLGGRSRFGWALLLQVDVPEKITTLPPAGERVLAESLDGLAEIFGNRCHWILTGALSIATTIGRFYRAHHDLDIASSVDETERVTQVASLAGYALFRRAGSTKVGFRRRLTFYRTIKPKAMASWPTTQIRFLRAGRIGWRVGRLALLDAIDFYTYEDTDGHMITRNPPMRIRMPKNHRPTYRTISGREIPLQDMAYMREVKRILGSPKDELDLTMLAQANLSPDVF